jgi:hypothetical protein
VLSFAYFEVSGIQVCLYQNYSMRFNLDSLKCRKKLLLDKIIFYQLVKQHLTLKLTSTFGGHISVEHSQNSVCLYISDDNLYAHNLSLKQGMR